MQNNYLQILLALFRSPLQGGQYSDRQWEKLLLPLRHTNLMAKLFYLATFSNVFVTYPKFVQKHLTAAKKYADRQALQVRFECKEINKVLGRSVIEPVYLKGAGFTVRESRNNFGRIYSDIDLLIDQDELEEAQILLKRHGWASKVLSDYDEKYYREWAHEIPPLSHVQRGTTIDVHHNIIPLISGRAPDVRVLRDSLVKTDEGLLVLSEEAAFLHSTIHLFTNEDFSHGFRDIVDLYQLAEEFGDKTFWLKLIGLAEKTGFTLELYYCLACLNKFFDHPFPEFYNELKQQHDSMASRFVLWTLVGALKPHHPLIQNHLDRIKTFFIYIRGHWIKMPFIVLIKHLSIKAFFNSRDKLFGRHQFEKKS